MCRSCPPLDAVGCFRFSDWNAAVAAPLLTPPMLLPPAADVAADAAAANATGAADWAFLSFPNTPLTPSGAYLAQLPERVSYVGCRS